MGQGLSPQITSTRGFAPEPQGPLSIIRVTVNASEVNKVLFNASCLTETVYPIPLSAPTTSEHVGSKSTVGGASPLCLLAPGKSFRARGDS